MIRRFRPFWSYDIINTEAWLNKKSKAGYHLKQINFITRMFVFEKGERTDIRYRICYEKHFSGQISEQLADAGWEYLFTNGRFYILRNFQANSSVNPSYTNILDRNRKIESITRIIPSMLLLFFIVILPRLFTPVKTKFTVAPDGVYQITHVNSNKDLLFLSVSLYFIVIIWLMYIVLKLEKSNNRIERLYPVKPNMDFTIPTAGLMSKKEEKALLKSKNLIKKFKLAWPYSPDKTERWLEEMESKGYNLYRMNKGGRTFYFLVGSPRKIKYAVDYQIQIKSTYYNMNIECGWKLIFTSTNFKSITVWSHEYSKDEDIQEFYSDKQSKLRHARKYALFCFITFIILYAIFVYAISKEAFLIFLIIQHLGHNNPFAFLLVNMIISIVLQTLIVIVFGTFSFKTAFYYFRFQYERR
jgi:hypothetical protein